MRSFGALLAIFFCSLLAFAHTAFSADWGYLRKEADDPTLMVNRPVNIQGLTGLIVANSAYTQPKGGFTIGLSGLGENSSTPNYSIAQGIFTATYGASDRIEVGLRAKMIVEGLGSSSQRQTGAGDTDLLVKWRVTSQTDELPAVALGVGLILPTGDRDKGFSEAKHEGIRLMLIGAHEKEMPGGIVLGFYADGQVVLIDQLERRTGNPYNDRYGIVNAGILVPLTESNQLQVILEYNLVTGKSVLTLGEEDYTAITPGLRYVTPRFNFTAGVQFLNKNIGGYSNDERYIATISYRF